jgi:lipopolysaccharide export system permease protein
MILVELFKIFILALVGLTGIILLAGVISEAMKNGFGPAQLLACIPLLLPSLLPYTVPATTLFATCVVYGRLSADNEIIALKSAGIHIVHVVWPAIFLGAVMTGIVTVFYFDVIPATGSMVRNQIVGDVEGLLYNILQNESCIVKKGMNWEIHVKNMQGRKLQDVHFKRKAADGTYDTIAVAKEAELLVDLAHNQIHVDMRQCQVLQGESVGYVVTKIWPVEIPPDFASGGPKHRPMDMTWSELLEYEAKIRHEIEEENATIDLLTAQNLNRKPSAADEEELLRHVNHRSHLQNVISAIAAEWCMRPAWSFGCLCFALVGCPIGIWFSKSDFLSAFISCFLPIVIVYYPAMFCMFDLARAGKIPAWAGIFNADALLLCAGGYLFWRLARN